MPRRRSTTGIFQNPVTTTQQRPQGDPIEAALAQLVSDAGTQIRGNRNVHYAAEFLKTLQPNGASNGGGSGPLPQPTGVQDILAMNREARESSKEYAELARQQALEERERRERAEAESGSAFSAGKEEASNFYEVVMTMFKELSESKINAISQAQQEKDEIRKEINELKDQMTAAQIESVRKEFGEIKEEFRQELAKKEAKIAELEQKHQAAAGKYDSLIESVMNGKEDHPILQLHKRLNGGKRSFADIKEEVDAQRYQSLAEDEQEERRLARIKKQKESDLLDTGKKFLEENVGPFMKSLAGAATTKLPESEWPEGAEL